MIVFVSSAIFARADTTTCSGALLRLLRFPRGAGWSSGCFLLFTRLAAGTTLVARTAGTLLLAGARDPDWPVPGTTGTLFLDGARDPDWRVPDSRSVAVSTARTLGRLGRLTRLATGTGCCSSGLLLRGRGLGPALSTVCISFADFLDGLTRFGFANPPASAAAAGTGWLPVAGRTGCATIALLRFIT